MWPAGNLSKQWSNRTTWQVSLRILHDYPVELLAFEVTPRQAGALLYLQENPGSHIRQCAKTFGVTGPAMGVLINRLHQNGWLRKQRASRDDRYVILTVTREGTELVKKITRLLDVARTVSTTERWEEQKEQE